MQVRVDGRFGVGSTGKGRYETQRKDGGGRPKVIATRRADEQLVTRAGFGREHS